MPFDPLINKLGVLGGGQLGKMLAEEAKKIGFSLYFMDKSRDYPAGKVNQNFTEGDFNCYDDVLQFGQKMQIVTIEIEHVNIPALYQLERQGIQVYPQPSILELIQDKGLQKQFYQEYQFPTAPFHMFETTSELLLALSEGKISFPFVQKLRRGGYDGKGVEIIRKPSDLGKLLGGSCIVEALADINKEISVIAVRNTQGQVKIYPAVSMDFHPTANLVEYVVCPAEIPQEIEIKAKELAYNICKKLEIIGLLAVEMFYNKDNSIWINEMAPRPHNSGHHTLDNGATSQFENHIRALTGLPLGDTHFKEPSIMLNLLGDPAYQGIPIYQGLENVLKTKGIHVHLYGKNETRPFRKMGHVTITGKDIISCKEKAKFVEQNLKVIA